MKIDIPLQILYLSYVNEFITQAGFADWYGLTLPEAADIIQRGREQQERNAHCTPGNIAFWNYDSFPYLLHGVIEEVGDRGTTRGLVYIESYQAWFTPAFCLSAVEGAELGARLLEIQTQYENRVTAERIVAMSLVRDQLPKHVRERYSK